MQLPLLRQQINPCAGYGHPLHFSKEAAHLLFLGIGRTLRTELNFAFVHNHEAFTFPFRNAKAWGLALKLRLVHAAVLFTLFALSAAIRSRGFKALI